MHHAVRRVAGEEDRHPPQRQAKHVIDPSADKGNSFTMELLLLLSPSSASLYIERAIRQTADDTSQQLAVSSLLLVTTSSSLLCQSYIGLCLMPMSYSTTTHLNYIYRRWMSYITLLNITLLAYY